MDPEKRVEQMRLKLDELEKDPRNLPVSKYLRAEMVHLMNTFQIKPREYKINEVNVR